ncbi:hypothetical protein E2986_12427 [Frieseomelitta varia]|uniref:Uncharacterized protein n=1 Tax=Frieseomelitta varia TaxID=561572 RepID=A0A833S673_9HYME|nr:hypothetical protein E2986_12427 [Frieseomelitta varia]
MAHEYSCACNFWPVAGFLFRCNEHSIFGDNVGLAISQSLGIIGSLQHVVKRSGKMISHVTSVDRILEYNNLPKEPS